MNKKIICVLLAVVLFGVCVPFLGKGRVTAGEQMQPQPEIVLLGDSIFGQERGETSVAGLLAESTGKSVFCGALGGSCMGRMNTDHRADYTKDVLSMDALAEAVVTRDFGPQRSVYVKEYGTEYFDEVLEELETVDFDKVQVLFFNQGINDYHAAIPLEDAADPLNPYTFAGALRRSVYNLREAYPDLRIILVTPTYSWYNKAGETQVYPGRTRDFGGGTLEEYVAKETDIAEELGVEVLDVFHDFYPDEDPADCWRYTLDGVHPNEDGRRKLAEAMQQILE